MLLPSCAAVTTALGGTLTVDEAEIAALPSQSRAALEPAAKAEAEALRVVSTCEERLADASREVEVASWGGRRAEAGLKIAQLRFSQAQATKAADAILPAREARAVAERELVVAKVEQSFRRAVRDLRDAEVDRAEAARDVTTAELQLQRLNALLAAKEALTPDDADRRASFEKQLAGRKAALVAEEAAIHEADAAMNEAERAWHEAEGDSGAATSKQPVSPSAPQPASAGATGHTVPRRTPSGPAPGSGAESNR